MSTHLLLLVLEAVKSEDLSFLEYLIEERGEEIDLNDKDEDGITSLHIAAGLENNDILDYLLNHGAQVDSQTFEGLTPLHIAAMWGRSLHVATLLHHKADQSCLDVHGCSALMYALNSAEEGSQNCVDLLLAHQENCRLSLDHKVLPQNSPAKSGQITPESEIDLDKLNDSPWITPRRESKKKRSKRNWKAMNGAAVNDKQFLNNLECSDNDESVSSNVASGVKNLTKNSDQVLSFEELLTELSSNLLSSSGQDSSKDSNSSTFSYSSITCLDSQKLSSLSNVECSEYRTLYGSGFVTECSLDEKDEKGNKDVTKVKKCGDDISIIDNITGMSVDGQCAYVTAIEDVEEVKENIKESRNDLRENENLRKVSKEDDGEAVKNVEKVLENMKRMQIRNREDAESWIMNSTGYTGKIMREKIQKVRDDHSRMKSVDTLSEAKKKQDVKAKVQPEKKTIDGEKLVGHRLYEVKNGEKKECSKNNEAEKIEIYHSNSENDNDDNERNRQETGCFNDVFNNSSLIKHDRNDTNDKLIKQDNEHKPFEDSPITNPGITLNSTFLVDSPLNRVSKQSSNFFIPFPKDTHSIHKAKTSTSNVRRSSKCEETIIYDWRELSIDQRNETIARIPPNYMKISCNELRKKIKDHGQIPGPITPQTKMLYVKKLWKLDKGLEKGDAKQTCPVNLYPEELKSVLTGRAEILDCNALEQDMMKEFDLKAKKAQWRGGAEKSSFNYLLLDPRVTLDLPQRAKKLSMNEAFRSFILAIFYVGKGKRSRPYAHLREAIKYSKSKSNKKLEQIWDIWKDGMGVISLHLFQSAIPVESFTREACMVEALGLSQLTNQKRGEYYGLCAKLGLSKKRKLGIFFLHKAFQIFLQEGERQICMVDF